MSSKGQHRYPQLQRDYADFVRNEDWHTSQWNDDSCTETSMLANQEHRNRPKSSPNIRNSLKAQRSDRSIAWAEQAAPQPHKHPARKVRQKMHRPTSAPAHHMPNRRSSLSSVLSSNSSLGPASSELSRSGQRMRRSKPLYKQANKVVCVRAFVNGDRDSFARVTAPNLKQLLEQCTRKLGLVTAARKVFLADGTLVNDFHQIPKNADIYVSCGEPFKHPFGKYIEKEKLSQMSTWTMNGIVFPESETRGKTRPSLSERLQVLVEKQKKRVLVFENVDYTKGKEIVAGRFDEFLSDCTDKLGFQSRAKALYDWDGKEITSFSEVPVVEHILQPSSNSVFGPVWVTRGGEKFSFKGPFGFVDTLLQTTKERLKEAKDYENQLQLRLDGNAVQAPSVEVMSFTEEEAKSELQQVCKKVRDLEAILPKLKSRRKKLLQKERDEDMVGANHSSYKFQNIAEIEENSRLLGQKGIRLKVYENGKIDDEVVVYFNIHEASKGLSGDRGALLGRLLDAITAHQKVLKQGHGPAGRPVARRIFKDNGKEVLNVHELQTDDSVWLSFGEKFQSPYIYCLQLNLDKTKCVSLWNEKKILQRESLSEEVVYGKERASLWRTVDSYPSDCKYEVIEFEMEEQERVSYAKGLQHSQIREKNTFLQCKSSMDLILFPELSVEKKLVKGDNIAWPSDYQQWLVHKSGHITSRSFPQLCLSATDIKVNVSYPDEISLDGLILKFAKRNSSDPNQKWKFTPTGYICNESHPSLVLTWIANENHRLFEEGHKHGSTFGEVENNGSETNEEAVIVESLSSLKDVFAGEKCAVALVPKLPAKHQAIGTQRWAIKQESIHTIGQWKFSQVSNPEWNRRALSWPVDQDGTLNEEFNWPLEGFLVCNAPPVKRKQTLSLGPPVRLRVLKNGVHDVKRAVTVVGPDLGNMARDVGIKSSNHSTKTAKKTSPLPSSRNDIRNLELNLFLDRCTDALELGFAARRLFDEHGTELFTLNDLERNQLVFVSCGEAWIDFSISHSDQQRRVIMNNLCSDVAKLRLYCALTNPQGLLLTIEGTVCAGSAACVANNGLTEHDVQENIDFDQDLHESQSDHSIEGVRSSLMSAHERAHVKSDERLKSLQWPWETAITTNGDVSADAEQHGDFQHDVVYSDNRLHKRYRHHTAKPQSSKENLLLSCQWFYEDGWIQLRTNNQLVLGISKDSSEEKLVNELFLCKKRLDDANQRWTLAPDGTIHLQNNANATLTVSDPGRDNEQNSDKNGRGYDGSYVLVMPRRPCHGNANQVWKYDQVTGFISAFATDSLNLEITAANKSGICTYAVLGPENVAQIGYSMQNGSSNKYLCEACGITSRGKYILQKLEQSQEFSCAMGKRTSKQDKSTCFKCLSYEVELSSQEADATLAMWEDQLKRLRKITSVRSLNKEIQAAQSQPAVRIRAYKNGEGLRKEPVLVIASTVDSLLEQCTCRLSLPSAARRLYNIDGEHITDIDQLRAFPRNESTLPRKKEKVVKGNLREKPSNDAVDLVYTANNCKNDSNKDDEQDKDSTLKNSESRDGNYCVDVFVSCGEAFVPLEEVDRQYFLQMKHQYARNWVENHLETEKHILRQIQGRRLAARSSIEVRSLHDLTKQEEDKQENIEELTEHLKDLKTKQQEERGHVITANIQSRMSSNARLYDSFKTVRIDVYENGDAEKRYVNVCGSSLMEILNICTSRLGLSSAARRMFTATGEEIEVVSELVKGEIYCVSCGENFVQPKDRQSIVERKATWSRLNRLTGGAMAYKNHERTPSSGMLALTAAPNQLTYY